MRGSFMNSGNFILEYVAGIGGLSVVIGAVSAWLSKLWANRILQKQVNNHNITMAELSTKLQKEIEKSKLQFDLLKEYSVRYSEHQFKLYNELWGELYSLEVYADALWDNADQSNMRGFIQQLKETNEVVKKNALLIEKEHLLELLNLLKEFGGYKLGKESLIKYRDRSSYIENYQIHEMINSNRELKIKYSEMLKTLEEKFRRQIKYFE